MTFDILIRSGQVYDGIDDAPRQADIGIQGGRVAAIADLGEAHGRAEIDASGHVVCPGFVDIHGHSDLSAIAAPRCESKVHQGVTTEVCGQCGYSPAPVSVESRENMRASAFFVGAEIEWNWLSFDEYLAALQAARPAMNLVCVVGHGALRGMVVGYDDRPATEDDVAKMGRLLEQSLEAGGAGISTGLVYPPGSYSSTEEIIALSRIAARHRKGYYTHMRNEGDHLMRSVEETIRIGRESGAACEIAHHKAAGPSNWGGVRRTLDTIAGANAKGVPVLVDVYPYTAGSTTLTALIPQSAHSGGREQLLARLRDPKSRAEIRDSLDGHSKVARGMDTGDDLWSRVLVAGVADQSDKNLEGLSLAELGSAWDMEPSEALLDLLLRQDGKVTGVMFSMCEEDMRDVLTSPLSAVGSDASAVSAFDGEYFGKPHPRAYGTFPRVLGKYVREEKLLPLGEAIRKMTSEPASRVGLHGRGVLREGGPADVVVFDPETIRDRADYKDPHQHPSGIRAVIVNGVAVVEDGRHTGAQPGRVLRM